MVEVPQPETRRLATIMFTDSTVLERHLAALRKAGLR